MSDRKYISSDEGESYFISMTDMMIGVLFVFIIMLMAFALNLREEKDNFTESIQTLQEEKDNFTESIQTLQEERDNLTKSTQTRTEILRKLQHILRERGVNVKIDKEQGVLRLPEQILFSKGSAKLSASGIEKIGILADVLMDVLPCYTFFRSVYDFSHLDCSGHRHYLDAVLIEGHTDSTKYGEDYDKNWDLSADRAISAFRSMTASQMSLTDMLNPLGQKILSVSGYADSRPANPDDTEAAENRRIDLRLIMAVPNVLDIK